MTLWLPTKHTVDCAAIYMTNGYYMQSLRDQDEMEIQDYLCDAQPRWQSTLIISPPLSSKICLLPSFWNVVERKLGRLQREQENPEIVDSRR